MRNIGKKMMNELYNFVCHSRENALNHYIPVDFVSVCVCCSNKKTARTTCERMKKRVNDSIFVCVCICNCFKIILCLCRSLSFSFLFCYLNHNWDWTSNGLQWNCKSLSTCTGVVLRFHFRCRVSFLDHGLLHVHLMARFFAGWLPWYW